ncbi:MAG: LysM peptidoglycan-binding domain-containing protein [Candidatus Sumerlaeia bacterium]
MMKTFFTRNLFVPLCLSVILVLLFSACNVSPEKDPAFLKMAGKIKALEDAQNKTQRSVESLYLDVDILTEELKKVGKDIRSLAQNDPNSEKMMTTLSELEKLQSQLNMIQAKLDKQQAELSETSATVTKLKNRPATVVQASPKPRTSAAATSTKSPQASAAKPKPEEKKAAGFYYQVKKDDTLQSIAEKFKIGSADILRANRLPMSAAIFPGQSIYIPQNI